MDCGEVVAMVEVKVCLHKKQGGVWIKMGCRAGISYSDGDGRITRRVVEPCAQKQTLTYKVRARGTAIDGTGPTPGPGGSAEIVHDSATATQEFYCPGSVSGAAAGGDGVEYAESWLPTSE
jgi:hypothetical protein